MYPNLTTETRSLKKYNKALFQQDLQEIDWDCILAPLADEPSKMVITFQEIFESRLNVFAPLKVKKLRNEFAPWLTSSVRDLMTKRDRMKKAAKKILTFGQIIKGYVINAAPRYEKQFRIIIMD